MALEEPTGRGYNRFRQVEKGLTVVVEPRVAVHSQNLLSQERVADIVRRGGAAPVSLDEALKSGVQPALVMVEMTSGEDSTWQRVLTTVRERWPDVPVIAFGPHVDVTGRQAARRLGASQVLSRGRFFREGPAMVASYVAALADPTGCGDPPDEVAREGMRLFDAGEYYECHELLEEAWRAEQRPCRNLYQGILQLGIALYHIRRGHFAAALKMLRRAEHHLRPLPDVCRGIDVARLREMTRQIHETLLELGPEGIGRFPQHLFARLPYVGDVAS